MSLGNNNPMRQNNTLQPDEAWVIQLLSSGLYAEAYLLLKREASQTVPALYNMALCCLFAGNYEQALYRLDEALSVFRATPDSNPTEEDELYKNITAAQNNTASYRLGVTEKYAQQFPSQMKDSILRLKIDCYLALQQWNKLIETAALLKTKNYSNVLLALEQAEKATTMN